MLIDDGVKKISDNTGFSKMGHWERIKLNKIWKVIILLSVSLLSIAKKIVYKTIYICRGTENYPQCPVFSMKWNAVLCLYSRMEKLFVEGMLENAPLEMLNSQRGTYFCTVYA